MSTPPLATVVPLDRHRPRGRAEPLTEARVRRAEPRARPYFLADSLVQGLALRVTPTGAKTYVLRSRVGLGREAPRIDLKIAPAGTMTLTQARDAAREMLIDLRRGIDPRLPKPGATQVQVLLDQYERSLVQRGVVNRRHILSTLRRNLVRHKARPIGDLTRLDFVAIVEAIEASGRPGAAQDFRAKASAFLNYCADTGHLHASPLAGYRRARTTRAQKLAERRLTFTTSEGLRQLWAAFDAAHEPAFRDLLRLALLTGQRRGELAQMRWRDLDLTHPAGARWVIPAALRKTGEAHTVPLGPQSRQLIAAQPRHADVDLVFPAPRTGRVITGWSERVRPVCKALGEPTFALHALRRSYRSGLSEIGVDWDTAERQIGHARPGLLGIYDKSDIWPRRVAAQERWETHLQAVISSRIAC